MEKFNDNGNNRLRSDPEGWVATREHVDFNVVATERLQLFKREFEMGETPIDFADYILPDAERRLFARISKRNHTARLIILQDVLGYHERISQHIPASKLPGMLSDQESNLKGLLALHFGWDNDRVDWLLSEMDASIADELRLALWRAAGNESAREVIQAVDFSNKDEAKSVLERVLDDEAKSKVDYPLNEAGYLDPHENPLYIRDFEWLVEIMEASTKAAVRFTGLSGLCRTSS